MGPTLAVLARRAADASGHPLEIIAVSRFRDPTVRQWFETRGVRTVSCDLLDAAAVTRLPDAQNIVYLVGLKFGTTQSPATTWAMNTLVPARVCERYPHSRMVALSTANVYPLSEVKRGGSVETDALTPVGEYANAAVGRERIFEFYSPRIGTSVCLLRLCYAVELRYGVLVDLVRQLHAGEPIPLATGHFNCIWQGDANEMILRALPLAASPPSVWNLSGPEVFSVRDVAGRLSNQWGWTDRTPRLIDEEAATALLINSSRLHAELGPPATSLETMLRWIAHWVPAGGSYLNKPTHFEVRDGVY